MHVHIHIYVYLYAYKLKYISFTYIKTHRGDELTTRAWMANDIGVVLRTGRYIYTQTHT